MTGYWLYVVKRLLQVIPLILGIVVLNFVIVHVAPGDPAFIIAGENAPLEYLEEVRIRFGLNKPLHEQLFLYIIAVAKGDLGYSFYYSSPVLDLILSKLPASLLLMGTQLIFATIVGIFLGVISAKRSNSLIDYSTTTSSLVGFSIPPFWLGQIFVLLFSVFLGWFPSGGIQSYRVANLGIEKVFDIIHHLVLPALTLGLYNLALITRLTRTTMIEVLEQDFITTARSKGLSDRTITYKHALRNATLPIVTIVGMQLGYMFAGSVTVETVFSWPGLGRLAYEAILTRDFPLILGLLVFVSGLVILAALVTDIIYGLLDPRVRYAKK